MGFLDQSTNNIIVDAVLTDKGRAALARNDGSFNLYKFGLADDEVDYTIIQQYGRTVGKEKIEKNTPVMEALTIGSLSMKYKLLSASNEFLSYLPQLTIDTGTSGVLSLTTNNTTPDQSFIARILQMAKLKGANYALLEVSSHSIAQKRIKNLAFNVFCFTNLSQDHLDYHKDMETYFHAKLSILDMLRLDTNIIVNIDDEYGKIFLAKAKDKGFKIETIGFCDEADVKLRVTRGTSDIQVIEIIRDKLIYVVQTHLIGAFQAINLGMALLTCEKFGFEFEDMVNSCNSLKPVPGRLEFVGKTKKGALVYVDFAHTPDALKHLLETLRELTKGELVLVFGAGGERDKDKRKPMGAIAYKYCDLIYVTDDNPRYEDAKFIRKQIIEGCPIAIEIEDRAEAITTAIQLARLDDVVIIAGKGHEQVQIVRDNYFPFSDFEQASVAIELME